MSMPVELEYFHVSARTEEIAFRRRLLEVVLALCSLKHKTEGNYALEGYARLCLLRRQHVILMESLAIALACNGLAYWKTNFFWLSTHWLE